MKNLFKTILLAMEENNEINNASFNDWDSAEHAIETYQSSCLEGWSEEEMKDAVKALDLIIESNGDKYEEAIKEWNIETWGQNFADNIRSVAFSV